MLFSALRVCASLKFAFTPVYGPHFCNCSTTDYRLHWFQCIAGVWLVGCYTIVGRIECCSRSKVGLVGVLLPLYHSVRFLDWLKHWSRRTKGELYGTSAQLRKNRSRNLGLYVFWYDTDQSAIMTYTLKIRFWYVLYHICCSVCYS